MPFWSPSYTYTCRMVKVVDEENAIIFSKSATSLHNFINGGKDPNDSPCINIQEKGIILKFWKAFPSNLTYIPSFQKVLVLNWPFRHSGPFMIAFNGVHFKNAYPFFSSLKGAFITARNGQKYFSAQQLSTLILTSACHKVWPGSSITWMKT